MRSYKVISAATGLPVSLNEFKEHLGIYHTEKDNNLTILLKAAVNRAEIHTGRVFRTGGETIEKYMSGFPGVTEIDYLPVTGISSVEYFDGGNEKQTLTTGYYDVNLDTSPPLVVFDNPPAVYSDYRHNAVIIQFVAGYADADSVPFEAKAAILLIAQNLYDNPGDAVKQLPTASESLLRGLKVN